MAASFLLSRFRIPGRFRQADLDKHLRWEGSGKIRLSPSAEKIGFFSICYRHRADNTPRFHRHDFFEIFMVLEGEGTHLVESVEIPIRAGDLVFVSNQERHAFRTRGKGMVILNLCFLPSAMGYANDILTNSHSAGLYSLLSPFGEKQGGVGGLRLSLSEKVFEKIAFQGLLLAELYFENAGHHREAIRHLLKVFLHLAFEEYRRTRPASGGGRVLLLDVMRHIEERYAEKISRDTIAARLGINKNYFSTLFNQHTGQSLNEVVNELRIAKARELLSHSALPVSAVALETGFGNFSHFNFVFKKTVGSSPLQYRKKHALLKSE